MCGWVGVEKGSLCPSVLTSSAVRMCMCVWCLSAFLCVSATMGFFPVDSQSIKYLSQTGRPKEKLDLVEGYLKAMVRASPGHHSSTHSTHLSAVPGMGLMCACPWVWVRVWVLVAHPGHVP